MASMLGLFVEVGEEGLISPGLKWEQGTQSLVLMCPESIPLLNSMEGLSGAVGTKMKLTETMRADKNDSQW